MEPTTPSEKKENSTQKGEPVMAQEEQKPDITGATRSEMSSMVNLLAASIQGMQGSLGNAYQSMANNLKQSMEMTMAMSSMMEKLLLSSMLIKSRIERRDGRIRMTLMTENTSQFPLPKVSGTIRLTRQNDEQAATVDIRPTWLSSRVESLKEPTRTPIDKSCSIFDQPETCPEPTLGPGTRWVEVYEWDLKTVDNWLVLIQGGFSSPGTGRRMTKEHECCIYVVDQYDVRWLAENESEGQADEEHEHECRMRINALRETLRVPAIAGVSSKDRFVFSLPAQIPYQDDGSQGPPPVVYGRVTEISADGQEAVCRIGAPTASDIGSLVALRIAQELQVLGQ